MRDDDDPFAAISAIYDAAIAEEFWQRALDRCGAFAGSRAVSLLMVDAGITPYQIAALSSHYDDMVADGRIEHYMRAHSHLERAAAERVWEMPARVLVTDNQIYPDEAELEARDDYRYLREHAGLWRRAYARLNDNRGWYDAISFLFPAGLPEVPQAALRRIRPLLPHLAKSVELGRSFSLLRARYQAVLQVLDRVQIGVCISQPGGEVIVANDEAERIFSLSDGVGLGPDRRLVCRVPEQTARLAQSIAEAASTASGQGRRATWLIAIRRRSSLRNLLVEVAPLSDSLGELERNLRGAIVTLIDPDNPRPFALDRFAQAYGLSGAEAEVCRMMVEGLTGAEIAERRGVSPQTVKTQMTAVLRKADVPRRSDLIRLVIRTSPPVE